MNPSNFLIELFYKTATGRPRLRLILAPLAGAGVICVLCLYVLAALWLDKAAGLPNIFSNSSWNIITGSPLAAIGFFLTSWSVARFLKARGTPAPFNPPPKLVSEGPYAHVRNPMLSGIFFMFFGLGFFFGSVCLIGVFTPLLILLNYIYLKKVEEPELVKRLGSDYVEYRKKTPMFIPRIKKNGDTGGEAGP
jgi:protein-S-isoprenylcysteine O-methyltransferase Ste14